VFAAVSSCVSFGHAGRVTEDNVVINPNAAVYAGTSAQEAASIVAPTGVESSASSGLNTAIRSAPRSYQEYIAASNFAADVTSPTSITGMQLRLAIGENWRPAGYAGSNWPSQPITLGTFTVTLAKPSAGLVTDGEYLSTTPTFASYLNSPVVVRTGTLTIPAGAFSADGGDTGVHSWGPVITFSTPYTINPGEGLVMQINHSGYTPSAELNAFFASRDYANGVTDAISSTASGTAAAPSGFSSPYFVNFVTVVPEPMSLGLIGATLLVSRRRR
jgi:hypothetical protein